MRFVENSANLSRLPKVFNSAHPNIKFTLENEENNQIAFLDVLLRRRSDGSLQRNIHRKPTWNNQYIHFKSFVPLDRKRNLIRCLSTRARRICTEDAIENELTFLRDIFLQNGYPERFVDSVLRRQKVPNTITTVGKKSVYISLPFKGDTVSEIASRKLTAAMAKTFFAAQLRIVFTSRPLLCLQLKDNLPVSAVSYCVYSFTCSCGTTYIGRTTRRLSERVREHHPAWLHSGVTKSITSAIVSHLVESNHVVNVAEAFRPIYVVRRCQSKGIRARILATAEAIGIRLNNPPLCSQKQFVRSLGLPWPSPHVTVSSPPLLP